MMLIKKLVTIASLCLLVVACNDDMLAFERLQAMKPGVAEKPEPLPQPAADDLQGQFDLATQYQQRNDWVSAMEWFSLCANAGHKPCVRELGYGYLQGAGVESDPYLGLQLLQTSLDENDPTMLNDLAWFMATSKESSLRNPAKALELMALLQSQQDLDAMTADTLAAAQAASGQFQLAANTQKKALNMLIRQGRMAKDILSGYRLRLKLYRSEQAYLE